MEKFKSFFAGTNRRLRITTAIIIASVYSFKISDKTKLDNNTITKGFIN